MGKRLHHPRSVFQPKCPPHPTVSALDQVCSTVSASALLDGPWCSQDTWTTPRLLWSDTQDRVSCSRVTSCTPVLPHVYQQQALLPSALSLRVAGCPRLPSLQSLFFLIRYQAISMAIPPNCITQPFKRSALPPLSLFAKTPRGA